MKMKKLMIAALAAVSLGVVPVADAADAPNLTMKTTWGERVTSANAWREYPRPQMVRENWTCLNGDWDYAVTKIK